MDTHPRFVRFEVARCQQTHVVGRNHRHIELCRNRQAAIVDGELAFAISALQFEVIAVTKNLGPLADKTLRFLGLACQQRLPRLTLPPPGEHNHTIAFGKQPVTLDNRDTLALPLLITARHQTR